MPDPCTSKYSPIARLLHWAILIPVIFAWTSAIVMDRVPKLLNARSVHIVVGFTIESLLVIRAFWRFLRPPPPPPATTSFGSWLGRWTDPACLPTQFVLYDLLFVTPLSGTVLHVGRRAPLPFYGVLEMPPTIVLDTKFIENIERLHRVLAYALIGIAGFHALSVILHHLVFRDGTLSRMFSQNEK